MLKKGLLTILSIVFLSAPCSAAKWTFMVYLDGDNNLERDGIDDVNEMETVGSTQDVNIVVLFDRAEGYTASNGDWTTGRVALIRKDNDRGRMSSFDTDLNTTHDWGELDMGHPKTLTRFIRYGIKTYPAEKYALILWNHGGGWRDLQLMDAASRGLPVDQPGFRYDPDEHVRLRMLMGSQMSIQHGREICSDDSSHNVLYTREVRGALEKIPQPLHLIGMDACLMSMVEVAYELRDQGEVLVGSQETEPAFGWPYHILLPPLVKNPDMDAADLGRVIVRAYKKFCDGRSFSRNPPTQSAIRLSEMNAVADAVNRFVSAVPQRAGRGIDFIDIRNGSPAFHRKSYIDYRKFMGRIPAGGGLDAGPVAAALRRAVIDNYSYKSGKATGLSVFFPVRADSEFSAYKPKNIQFAKDTLWDDFLAYIHKGTPIPHMDLPPLSPSTPAVQPPSPPSGSPAGKPAVTISRLIAVRDKGDETPADRLQPGETVWLKAYYRTTGAPDDHREVIVWGLFDPRGAYVQDFERLQVEDATDGQWVATNRVALAGGLAAGKYYAFCDINLFSTDPTRKAGDYKVGEIPIGVDRRARGAVPRIDRSTFDVRKKRLINQGKLIVMEKSSSPLKLRVAVNKQGALPEYQVKDSFKIGVKTAKDAYFALLAKQTEGNMAVIFPNRQNPKPFVKGGEITYFPPRGRGSLSIGPPGGLEHIKVLAATRPITPSALESYFDTGRLPLSGEWDETGLAIRIEDRRGPLLDKSAASGKDFVMSAAGAPPAAAPTLADIYNLHSGNGFGLRLAFNVQGDPPVFQPGQRGIKIGVKPAVNAHIALLHRNAQGQTSLLMSGQTAMDFAPGNQVWYFPPANAGALSVSPPYGVSEVKAVATQDRLNWGDLVGVYRYLTGNPGRWAGVVKRYEVR